MVHIEQSSAQSSIYQITGCGSDNRKKCMVHKEQLYAKICNWFSVSLNHVIFSIVTPNKEMLITICQFNKGQENSTLLLRLFQFLSILIRLFEPFNCVIFELAQEQYQGKLLLSLFLFLIILIGGLFEPCNFFLL